jgi:hypothetical protein
MKFFFKHCAFIAFLLLFAAFESNCLALKEGLWPKILEPGSVFSFFLAPLPYKGTLAGFRIVPAEFDKKPA